MADNVTTGTTGIAIAADDITSVWYQRIKVTVGSSGVATDASTETPFPVKIGDGTDLLAIDTNGSAQVQLFSGATAVSSAVPLGVKFSDGTTNQSIDVGGAARTTLYSTAATAISSAVPLQVQLGNGTSKHTVDVGGASRVTLYTTDTTAVTFNNNGRALMAASAPIVQATDTTFAYSASATFASATSASTYAANDVYNIKKEFNLSAPSGSRLLITSATLKIDTSATEATAWTLRLYKSTQDSSLADNAAFDLTAGDRSLFLGSISLGTPTDLGATLWAEADGINKQVTLSATSVYGYLTNVSSSTSITTSDHVVTLHAVAV